MKRLAAVILCGVMLTPVLGQANVVKLTQSDYDIHRWAGAADFLVNAGPLSASVSPLVGSGNFSVSVDPSSGFGVVTIGVEVRNYTLGDPPGAQNLKVAEVTVYDPAQEVLRCDVVLDNPYYARSQAGTVGGQANGEICESRWPTRDDGSYVPLSLATAKPATGYEFVEWVGDPVDCGYVPNPTAPPVKADGAYHATVGKQYYVKALFGVATRPGDTVVTLPQTPVTRVSLVYSAITAAGHTMLTQSSSGPSVPAGFVLGSPARYYDVTTTATYSGPITVSINYSGTTFPGSTGLLRLLHYEGGQWVDCTTYVDTAAHVIYGVVDSLSPFVVAKLVRIYVGIDIKPGSYPNSINLNGHGVIPVAILGSVSFDVTRIDPFSLSLADMVVRVKNNGTPQCSVQDVNGDGYDDLVCQFADNGTLPPQGTISLTLTGNLKEQYGATPPIEGSDEIHLVPR